ncbi:hypothetical protein SLA2020_413750 [Shorea laevis]
MDKSWMRKPKSSREYIRGVMAFVKFASENSRRNGLIVCPCKKCCLGKTWSTEVVFTHLTSGAGILEGYTQWIMHGEPIVSPANREAISEAPSTVPVNSIPLHGGSSGMQDMLNDVFAMHDDCVEAGGSQVGVEAEPESESVEDTIEDSNKRAKKLEDLLKDADTPLHANTKHSKLGAIVRLYSIKCMGGWSNTSFSMLLEFINELIPSDASLPKDTYEAKKYMRDLGLGYEKISACRKGCMLFWRENEKLDKCTSCNQSRWKDDVSHEDGSAKSLKKKPVKVLRWFPLIPRLQRLFMSHHTSSHMKWHAQGRTKDGVLRHPADGEAWKAFDSRYPDFASDPRNVRLGLASDGFNPFGNMSTSHSIWPVMLVPYNLPPWMCMKQPYFMLSLIIPGPNSPGQNIDVYLAPLVSELKELWEVGVQTFDITSERKFTMRSALMWTINDFPAYGDLSGWSTHGRKACPCCRHATKSTWLTYGRKWCYMGHRRWLSAEHQWRKNKRSFDGMQDTESAPGVPDGDEIMRQLEVVVKRARSGQKLPKDEVDWKRRSVLYDLPYWKDQLLRHNIDVMHTEKNVVDNILGTLLNMTGRTKDTLEARQDLRKMNLRPKLHPFIGDNNKTYLPAACFTMTKKEKTNFLQVLHDVRVPDGYSSNVSRCVKLKECVIGGLKSHDNHIVMQQLLPIALRGTLSDKVVRPLIELSGFFREICSKTLRMEDLDRLENRIPIILCQLEQIFPPGFFYYYGARSHTFGS